MKYYYEKYCNRCMRATDHYIDSNKCVECEERFKEENSEFITYNEQSIPEMLFKLNKKLENIEYCLNIIIEDLKSELAKR